MLAAAAALATAWLATPHAVPLFDGIGVPDEPYRYVTPPAGYQKTPAASSATITSPASGGLNTQGFYAQTAEISAQYGVFITPKALAVPTSASSVKITVAPEAPDGTTPDGVIDGNVYRVALSAGSSTTVTLTASGKAQSQYSMRATSAKIPAAKTLYRPAGGAWTVIPNTKGGTDSFQAYFQGAGDYALVATKAAATSSSHVLIIVIIVLVVLAMAGAVVLIRLSRRTAPEP
jgi:hypothetical protein